MIATETKIGRLQQRAIRIVRGFSIVESKGADLAARAQRLLAETRNSYVLKAGAPAGNQNAKKHSTEPEDYELAKSKGSLGRMGYFQSSNDAVRISAQITKTAIFVTRLDAVTTGQGEGSRALVRLKEFASATGRRIELTAGADDAEHQPQLNAFYERNGFKKTDDAEHPSFLWEPPVKITATLAGHAENILRAADKKKHWEDEGEHWKEKHNKARDAAQIIYEQAAIAAAHKIEKEKSRKKMEAAILILLLLAGEDAYLKTYSILGTEELQNADQTQISEQAKTFAAERQPLLEGYAKKLSATVEKTLESAKEENVTGEALAREIKEAAEKVSSIMAATEAQATYGNIQIDRLARAGFKTKIWATCEDEKVRQSHVDCGNQGAIKMGEKFINGLKYPGDPSGKPEDVCNCRCWLVGGAR